MKDRSCCTKHPGRHDACDPPAVDGSADSSHTGLASSTARQTPIGDPSSAASALVHRTPAKVNEAANSTPNPPGTADNPAQRSGSGRNERRMNRPPRSRVRPPWRTLNSPRCAPAPSPARPEAASPDAKISLPAGSGIGPLPSPAAHPHGAACESNRHPSRKRYHGPVATPEFGRGSDHAKPSP